MLNPRTTSALILGVSECPNAPSLQPLPQCANSAVDFELYLRNQLAIPKTNILNLFNSPDPSSEQLEQIDEWLKRVAKDGLASDLLVYYTGHGAFSGGDQSYVLAVHRTKRGMEGATSIRYSDLALCIKQRAVRARRYLILDCCFAASAVPKHQSSLTQTVLRKVEDELPPSGTAVLCSSSARLVSIAPKGERHTMFSGALLQCLTEGVLGGSKSLSLEDVGNRAREIIQEKYPTDAVRPELHVPEQQKGNLARVPLFPNSLWSDPHQEDTLHASLSVVRPPAIPGPSITEKVRSYLPRVTGLASGVLSAIGFALVLYPFGMSPDSKTQSFFPPIIPALCLTFAFLITAAPGLTRTRIAAIITVVWVSWFAAWNIVWYGMMGDTLPSKYTFLAVVGPAGFVGAFLLNIGFDIFVYRRGLSLRDTAFHAARSLPFGLLSETTYQFSHFTEEGPFSLWSSLALFVPWQLFIVEMHHPFRNEFASSDRWFSRMPFGRHFLKASALAFFFIASSVSFGSTIAIHVRAAFSSEPIIYQVRDVTLSDGSDTDSKQITISYQTAKTINGVVHCGLQLKEGPANEPLYAAAGMTGFTRPFSDAKASFEVHDNSVDSLLIRLVCLGEIAYESQWAPLDVKRANGQEIAPH